MFRVLFGRSRNRCLHPRARRALQRSTPCTPIDKTAKGELVYSLKCESLPAPVVPPPAPQAEIKPLPVEPESRSSGLFGWSFDRRKPED